MLKNTKQYLTTGLLAIVLSTLNICKALPASAASSSFRLSPMYQNVSLIPGESSQGTFIITNPANNEVNFEYKLYVQAFAATDDEDVVFENNGDFNQIVDWITLEKTSGEIAPNSSEEISFTINTPVDAPAGGQYAAIMVRQEASGSIGDAVNLKQNYEISHLIYADVAGETVRKGDITDVSVPSILFSGNISGTAKIKNLGNVHSRATHTLQVFPLFSNEEVYTNEETPQTSFIMPGTTKLTTTSWENTPSVGIFHVIYNVEYEGVESNVDKIVIICPLWLLFIIILALFLLIFKIFWGKKKDKK